MHRTLGSHLKQGSKTLFSKEHLGFADYTFSVAVTQLCHCSVTTVTDNVWIMGVIVF